jgi:ABC-2 type transport system permease protein
MLIVKKEVLQTPSALAFHLIALASPILVFLVFNQNLSQDISFPVSLGREEAESSFIAYLPEYTNPAGTPYYRIDPDSGAAQIEAPLDISVENEEIRGHVTQVLNGFNTNMIKNYRNRLHGAVYGYLLEVLPHRVIRIDESPLHETEPLWAHYFGVTILAFAALLSSALFGSLAFAMDGPLAVLGPLCSSHHGQVFAGKTVVVFLKSVMASILYISVVRLLLSDLPRPSVAAMLVIPVLCLLGTWLGMLVGNLVRDTTVSFIVTLILALVLWILGGGFGTTMASGATMALISRLNPVTGIIQALSYAWFGGHLLVGDVIYPVAFAGIVGIVSFRFYQSRFYLPPGERR